ncbi:hypothetical protein BGZ75_009244 [Mortierella antarctica]|nr:hypothetical protein BGZ75_009244 [Mortierella antarctica]
MSHAGRHAGTSERIISDWTWTISGILGDKPYFLERDLVNPPMDQQLQIFPWIENVFDDPKMKRFGPTWVDTCNEEMDGRNTETDPWFKSKEEEEQKDSE